MANFCACSPATRNPQNSPPQSDLRPLVSSAQRPSTLDLAIVLCTLVQSTVSPGPGVQGSATGYRAWCTHTHTLAHCTVQCRVVPTLLLELQTQPSRSEIYTFLQEVEVYSVWHVIVLCRDFGSRESIISSARLRNAAPEYGAERG